MTKSELIAKIEALNEWETLMEEAKAEAEAIRDSIKAEMLERETEELEAGAYIIRWTSSSVIDLIPPALRKPMENSTKHLPSKQVADGFQFHADKAICRFQKMGAAKVLKI